MTVQILFYVYQGSTIELTSKTPLDWEELHSGGAVTDINPQGYFLEPRAQDSWPAKTSTKTVSPGVYRVSSSQQIDVTPGPGVKYVAQVDKDPWPIPPPVAPPAQTFQALEQNGQWASHLEAAQITGVTAQKSHKLVITFKAVPL